MSKRQPEVATAYVPELGDYVLVPGVPVLAGVVGVVVGFRQGRAVVRSLEDANITVTVGSRTRMVQERCANPEHPDCLVSLELAVDCAQWTRMELGRRGA